MTGAFLKARFLEEPADVYHASGALSAHGLIELNRSPRHFWWKYLAKKDETMTESRRFGVLCHAALLEPDRYFQKRAVAPTVDRRTNAGKATYKEFQESLTPDRILVSAEEDSQIHSLAEAMNTHPIAKELIQGGQAELSGYWTDIATDTPCKMRPDYLHHDHIIVDLKIVRSGEARDFQRALMNYRYDVQAAWYCEGYAVINAIPYTDVSFIYLTVESDPPHVVNIFNASRELLNYGRNTARENVLKYVQCMTRNSWPHYSDEIKVLDLPKWAL